MRELMQQIVETYLCSPEAIEVLSKAVQSQFQKSITEMVTGYNSPLRKQMDEAIAKSLKIDGAIDVPSYNDVILKIIERQVRTGTEQAIEKQVAERMKTLLTPAPERIKLSELLEEYRLYLKDRYESGCVCHGESQFAFTIREESTKGFTRVCLWQDRSDRDKPTKTASPDIAFGVYKEKIYTLKINGADASELFAGPFYNFERKLFQMKAAETKIEMDINDNDHVDTHYGPEYD